MAATTSLVKTLGLVLLLATLANSAGDIDLVQREEPKFVTAMKGVRDVLECFGGNVKESLHALSEEVFQLREEIGTNKTALDLKCKGGDSSKVDQQTKTIAELNNKLAERETQIQDLGRRLGECQPQVEKLQRQVKELNITLESMKPADWTQKCSHPKFPMIKTVVRDFSLSRNWDKLKRGLGPLLDHSSEAFQQLSVGSVRELGHLNHIQLAALLICGGMDVDTADVDGNTMLGAAAWKNHLNMVKFLIEKGANVNAKGTKDWSVLMWAAYAQLQIVQSLVEAGADTTAKDTDGRNVLSWATSGNNQPAIRYLEVLPQ